MTKAPTLLLLTMLTTLGCVDGGDLVDTGELVFFNGPTLVHEAPTPPIVEGAEVMLMVQAEDNDGVDSVLLRHRLPGEIGWNTIEMEEDEALENTWFAVIPAEGIVATEVEYHFKAYDESEYSISTMLPEEGTEDPFILSVMVMGQELPFVEDFDASTSEFGMYDLRWNEVAEGFPGVAWLLSTARTHSGMWAAYHGSSSPGTGVVSDWMVSPPLDFTSLSEIQVSWYEYGIDVDLAYHSLWISTAATDPSKGGFTSVSDLAVPPEGEWGRSPIVNLSKWAGEEIVYLAWRYQGEEADSWYIDDISVEALGPDLELVEYGFSAAGPGEVSVLTATLLNHGAVTDGSLWAEGTTDEAVGSFGSPVDLGLIADGDTAALQLDLTISETAQNNAGAGVTLTASDDSQEWSWDLGVVIGEASSALIVFETTAEGVLEIDLGLGSIDAPEVELPVVVDLLAAGTYQYSLDLTDFGEFLPPGPGEDRWWVRVESSASGTFENFSIQWDGMNYVGMDVGDFVGGEVDYFYLPSRPDPTLVTSTTDPTPLVPGEIADWSVTLSNSGGSTQGLTTLTLVSEDPDVTVVGDSVFEIAADNWLAGGSFSFNTSLDVAITQDDSLPVWLTLVVEDEFEVMEIPVELEVPWPVLRVTGTEIEDHENGNDNGVIEVGESPNLAISVTNIGGLDTDLGLECVLSAEGGGSEITFLSPADTYSFLGVGTTKTEDDFQILLNVGDVGDQLLLTLTCTDARASYVTTLDLFVGEPSWTFMTDVPEAGDDAVGGYHFDILLGRYRVVENTMELVFESSLPYDPTTLFIEAYMEASGAPYMWYQLVTQSGNGTLRAYDTFNWSNITYPEVNDDDPYSIMITMDLEPMGLLLNTVRAGFAAGWCGSSVFYCDHYPNDWGDYYINGLSTNQWLTLEW